LAVNKSRKELANVNFSKGLTYLIDRNSLVSNSLNGFATPVWYPLNPAWSQTKRANLNPEIYSTVAAGNAFVEAGFVLDGDVREYQGKPVSLRLLVNRENAARVKAAQGIATALRDAGFSVEVVQATWDEYQKALTTLNFDLYLGEVNLPNNLDLSALFSPSVCNTGEAAGTYEALRLQGASVLTEEGDVPSFVSNFQNTLPLIPLYYSLDALAVSMDVTGKFGGSVTEFYAGIEHWKLIQK
jgi:peptide/nickel transport system substrate-binding protein